MPNSSTHRFTHGGTRHGARYTGEMTSPPDAVAVLRRWEEAGGIWRVIGRDQGAATVALYRCDGGEEADRFVSADPRLEEYLGGRTTSQELSVETRDRDRDPAGRARQARPRDRL